MQKEKIAKVSDIAVLEDNLPTKKTNKEDVVMWAAEHNIDVDTRQHKDQILQTIKDAMLAVPTTDLDDVNQEAMRVMDAYDTDLIIKGIRGQVDVSLKDAYIYEFANKGKAVRGFTKTGVDEMSTLSADHLNLAFRVVPDSIKVEETEDSFKATVIVGRYQLSRTPESCKHCGHVIGSAGHVSDFLIDTMLGAARQEKRRKTKSGYVSENPFAYRVAISKAVRNAKLSLMSHEFKVRMMSYLLGESAIKRLPEREKGSGTVILLTGDSYITETELKRIHAIAGKRGINHEGILEILKKFDCESTNLILSSDYPEIVKVIEAEKEIELSEELKSGLAICGKTEEWGLTQLVSGVRKAGSVEAAEKVLMAYLSRQADKEATK